jgi:hypothetical protein
METIPSAHRSIPVHVHALQRGWFVHSSKPAAPTTYLGVIEKSKSFCGGVLFEVSKQDLRRLDERERNYTRKPLDPQRIEFLTNNAPLNPSNAVWYYQTKQPVKPNKSYPILRSYLNICLNGFFELEETFSEGGALHFAERFIATTEGWSAHFHDDRKDPIRPHRHLKFRNKIQALVLKHQAVLIGGSPI